MYIVDIGHIYIFLYQSVTDVTSSDLSYLLESNEV